MPATAGAILAGNEKKDKFVIPLTGVAIGNGLTAPQIQYGYYGLYAETNPVQPLVPKAVSLAMRVSSAVCIKEIEACQLTPDYAPSKQVLDALAAANVSRHDARWRSLLLGPGGRHVWQGSDKDEDKVGRAVREGACDTAFVFCALSQVNKEIKKIQKKKGRMRHCLCHLRAVTG